MKELLDSRPAEYEHIIELIEGKVVWNEGLDEKNEQFIDSSISKKRLKNSGEPDSRDVSPKKIKLDPNTLNEERRAELGEYIQTCNQIQEKITHLEGKFENSPDKELLLQLLTSITDKFSLFSSEINN